MQAQASQEPAQKSTVQKGPPIDPKFSDIIDDTISKIVVLSDIHGDHDNFIVNLRDNAKVIRKRTDKHFDPIRERDPELDLFYHMDLNDTDQAEDYVDHLNYEWCGGNAHVVIVGDIIDPYRAEGYRYSNFYWPQMELKLVLFINAINRQASRVKGRVLKVLGNHDVANLLSTHHYGSRATIAQYIHPEDDPPEIEYCPFNVKKSTLHLKNGIPYRNNYHNDINRLDYFAIDQPGGKLLLEDNAYILLKINNYIFVHGNLPTPFARGFDPEKTPITYDEFNLLNWRLNHDRDPDLLVAITSDADGSLVWNRENYFDRVDTRFDDNHQFCQALSDKKDAFCRTYSVDTPTCFPEEIQIFVGHCIQFPVNCKTKNRTYTIVDHGDEQIERLITHDHSDIYAGPIDPPNRNVFGITLECPLGSKNDQYNIYRVDVGCGRGQSSVSFWSYIKNNQLSSIGCKTTDTPKDGEVFYLLSIAPQIVEIDRSGRISIVRSKIRNTRLHVPREEYEAGMRGVSGLQDP